MRTSVSDDLLELLGPGASGRLSDPVSGWPAVLGLADEHRLLPAVWAALRRRGVGPVPASARGRPGAEGSPLVVLERAYLENVTHTERLAVLRDQAIEVLADAGVETVPLKGAHWMLAGWLADPATRTTVDVDLLIDPARAHDAERALRGAAFTTIEEVDDEWADHQLPALLAPSGAASVELHLAPLISAHRSVLTREEIIAAASPVPNSGGPPLPSATDAVTLLIAHALLQGFDHRFRRLPLRALVDLVSLRDAGMLDDVDWNRVEQCFARAGETAALAGFAAAGRDLMGVDLPVRTSGGDRWLTAARRSLDSPRRARWQTRRAVLGLALCAPRMDRLYGTTDPAGRSWARVRHVATAPARRIRQP